MRLAALLFVVLALPAAALAADSFTDPRGDAGTGPDITAVTLSHTDAALTIAVDFASTPPLAYDEAEQYTDMLLVGIHTDDDLGRDDVEFSAGAHGVDLTRGIVVSARKRAKVGDADVTVSGSTLTLSLKRAVLGDPERIAVEVAAGREYVDEGTSGGAEGDFAPAAGPHRYALTDEGSSPWLWVAVAAGLAAIVLSVGAVPSLRQRPERVR